MKIKIMLVLFIASIITYLTLVNWQKKSIYDNVEGIKKSELNKKWEKFALVRQRNGNSYRIATPDFKVILTDNLLFNSIDIRQKTSDTISDEMIKSEVMSFYKITNGLNIKFIYRKPNFSVYSVTKDEDESLVNIGYVINHNELNSGHQIGISVNDTVKIDKNWFYFK